MRFYTNVQLVGNNFLVRGYENGKHFMTRETFSPTLFVPSKRKTKYKTLTGESMLNQSIPAQFVIVVNFLRSMMVYKILISMEMTDISINTSQRCIQNQKSSLI